MQQAETKRIHSCHAHSLAQLTIKYQSFHIATGKIYFQKYPIKYSSCFFTFLWEKFSAGANMSLLHFVPHRANLRSPLPLRLLVDFLCRPQIALDLHHTYQQVSN